MEVEILFLGEDGGEVIDGEPDELAT